MITSLSKPVLRARTRRLSRMSMFSR
uniref:Uncharacterized protein n=1 Tax=Arundo donax TaxID=35708 RepID=A0A0A9GIB0_ARUDO